MFSIGPSVRRGAMSCLSCASRNQLKLSVEMNMHFPGLRNLDKPSVWLFPDVFVCLDCGCSQFSVPTAELALVAEGAPKEKAQGVVDDLWLSR